MPNKSNMGAGRRQPNKKEPNEMRNEVLRILSSSPDDGVAQAWIAKQVNPKGDCDSNMINTFTSITTDNTKGERYATIHQRHHPSTDRAIVFLKITQEGMNLLARLNREFDKPPTKALLSHFDTTSEVIE